MSAFVSTSSRWYAVTSDAILFILRARALLILILLIGVFSILSPDFLTANSLSILAKHIAIFAILSVGTTFVVLTGGIDLSVGSLVGLGGMAAGFLITHGFSWGGGVYFPNVIVVVIVILLLCGSWGALNGLLVAKWRVAPFIATLGTLYMARGAALLISNGKTFPDLAGEASRGDTGLPVIGQGFLLHIPVAVWIMLVLFAVLAVTAAKTPFGRNVYAIGGNERAARLVGISIAKVKLAAYVISGLCAGVVGLIIASELEAAHPATGETFELNAIASVVLGGTSLMGGRGSVTGSLIGACVIGVLADGLVMLGVSEFWQMVIKGVVIILAVAVDQLQTQVQARLLPLIAERRESR